MTSLTMMKFVALFTGGFIVAFSTLIVRGANSPLDIEAPHTAEAVKPSAPDVTSNIAVSLTTLDDTKALEKDRQFAAKELASHDGDAGIDDLIQRIEMRVPTEGGYRLVAQEALVRAGERVVPRLLASLEKSESVNQTALSVETILKIVGRGKYQSFVDSASTHVSAKVLSALHRYAISD